VNESISGGGHAFLSYVREDTAQVNRLQQVLEDAAVRVWRDTADLWPGQDWRAQIRRAITSDALVFLVCFSQASVSRVTSYQNEELTLAIEQMRLRRPDDPWFIPIRFDDCQIPDREIGGGRTLSSIQRADLFGGHYQQHAARLVQAILRLLGQRVEPAARTTSASGGRPAVDVAITAPDASEAGLHPPVRSVVVVTVSGQIGDLTASYVTDQDRGGTTGLGYAPMHVSTGRWRIRSNFELRSVRDLIIGYTTVTAGDTVQWFQWDGYDYQYDQTRPDANGSHLSALQQIKEARRAAKDASH
jgi:TIR domain